MGRSAAGAIRGTAGKLERIRQLSEHGLNTPRLVRIEVGTVFDDSFRDFLRAQADGDELMTVRTYHPTDEVTYAKGPFFPEIPTEEAIRRAEELANEWHVLFQEAIDVDDTVYAGNVLLDQSGAGAYEVLRGRYRVRDVEHPPPGSGADHLRGFFVQPSDIEVPAIRDVVDDVLRSGLIDDVAGFGERVIFEFNVQAEPIGERHEPVLYWEWRPVGASTAAVAEAVGEAREDGGIYGVAVEGLVEPSGPSRSTSSLGGKGYALVRMAETQLAVPPAIVLAVPRGRVAKDVPQEWDEQLEKLIDALKHSSGRSRASVRSSPTTSMPGMLDTILDVELAAAPIRGAIQHVLASWWSERAVAYRRNLGIERAGLAVIIQSFVDGAQGARSGAGVGFTRDPRTGDPSPVIEFLLHARGDDVVGGAVTPVQTAEVARLDPQLWEQLQVVARLLEGAFADMQEFEFTVEDGRLFLLQSRPGKRSPAARVRIAYDLLQAGVVGNARARELLSDVDPRRLVARRLAPNGAVPLATARVASPGATSGRVAFSRAGALEFARQGEPAILCAETTSPLDYPVMPELAGLLTRHGGVTSHAAVVALEAGIVALVGCEDLRIDTQQARASFGGVDVAEGEWLSLDGTSGLIYVGAVREAPEELPAGLTEEAVVWATAAASGDAGP